MFDWIQDLFNASKTSIKVNIAIFYSAVESDNRLAGFGCKVTWYMIPECELMEKGWSIQDLADAIGLKNQSQMSWNDGIDFGYSDWLINRNESHVYISSPFGGWIYIINATQKKLNIINGIIDSYYAFGSSRYSGYAAWKQVKDKKTIRQFSDIGDEYINIGTQTKEEKFLNFLDLSGVTADKVEDVLYNDKNYFDESVINHFCESEVFNLCMEWTGINPIKFDELVIPLDERPKVGIGGILIRELNRDY